MKSISMQAPAKINLFLDITGKLTNGYHEIVSVMQSIDLFDCVNITLSDKISVKCSRPELDGEGNIAYKAAKLFFEHLGISEGVEIYIEKHIPSEAGMAGGSTDAAAVLKGLNVLYNKHFTEDELCAIGAKCGADVPFCIKCGTALCEGIGEKLTVLPNMPDCWFLIIKPSFGMSTVESYKYYDEHGLFTLNHPSKDEFIAELTKNSLSGIAKKLYNVLEHTVENPIIGEIKSAMLKNGAIGTMMTGSGTAVFGIFDNIDAVVTAKSVIGEDFGKIYLAKPIKSE